MLKCIILQHQVALPDNSAVRMARMSFGAGANHPVRMRCLVTSTNIIWIYLLYTKTAQL